MKMFPIRKLFVIIITFFIIGQIPIVQAQAFEEPIATTPADDLGKIRMRNVFLNVLWGSLVGGFTYTGASFLDDQVETGTRYSASTIFTKFVTGATYGGIAGLGAGVYLSFSNISFDQNMTRISAASPYQSRSRFPLPIRPPVSSPEKGPSIALFNYQTKF